MNNTSSFKTGLNFGSLSAISSFLFFLFLYYLGTNPLVGPVSWLGVWIPIVFIAIGIKKYRDIKLEGYISFRKALGLGMIITISSATLFAMILYIFGTVIDAGIVNLYIKDTMEIMERGKELINEQIYEQVMDQLGKTTISQIVISDFQKTILGGFLVSLVVAAILKNSDMLLEKEDG